MQVLPDDLRRRVKFATIETLQRTLYRLIIPSREIPYACHYL
jgi:hypothetical protein